MFRNFGELLAQRGRWIAQLLFLSLGMAIVGGLWWKLPPIPRLQLHSHLRCREIVLSGNGNVLAQIPDIWNIGVDDCIVLWDLASGENATRLECEVPSGAYPWTFCALSFDGMVLLAHQIREPGSSARTFLMDWREKRIVLEIPEREEFVRFSSERRTFLTHGPIGLREWEIDTGRQKGAAIPCRAFAGSHVRWEPQPKRWFDENADGTFTVFCLEPLSKQFNVTPAEGTKPIVSEDGSRAAIARFPEVVIFDGDTGKELSKIPAEGTPMFPLLFSPDGRRLVTSSEGGKQIVWDLTNTSPRCLGALDRGSNVAYFSPNGKWLVGGETTVIAHTTLLWDATTLEICGLVRDGRAAWHIPRYEGQFSPDSNVLVGYYVPPNSATEGSFFIDWFMQLVRSPTRSRSERLLLVWDLPNNRPMATFADCQSFALFPDSSAIAIAHPDGLIDIYDLPIRRSAWVEIGLPVLFVLLAGLLLRQFRRSAGASSPVPSPG